MDQHDTIWDKMARFVIGATVFTLPLFFLPITPDFYDWNKQTLLLGASLLLGLLWAAKGLTSGKGHAQEKPLGFNDPNPKGWGMGRALLALLAVIFTSAFLNPDYVSALMGRAMSFGALFLFYFAITQTVDSAEKGRRWVVWPLIAAAVVLALLQLAQFAGLFTKVATVAWITEGWTPAGSQFGQISILLAAVALLGKMVFSEFSAEKPGGELKTGLLITLMLVILPAATIFFSELPIRLPYSAAWKIATGVLGDSPKAAFLGFGPENFSAAFTRFRPLGLNTTPVWNVVFGSSANEPFQLLTTTGILGFLTWAALAIGLLKRIIDEFRREKTLSGEQIAILGLLALQIVFPPTIINWFVLIALTAAAPTLRGEEPNPRGFSTGSWAIAALALTVSLGYLNIRTYRGERAFYQALKAQEQNDGAALYNFHISALSANPQNYRYHQSFAQTNRLLADNFLMDPSQEALAGGEPSEEQQQQRNQALFLIQQSIDEAKTATNLAPHRFETWQTLAVIYRSLIGMTDSAPSWAITAYQNAIDLNPLDPQLRINLGGLFLGQGDLGEATYHFRLATQTKPDYANAWYNLAAAYRANSENEKAGAALQRTLTSLPEDSPDRAQVQEELQTLKEATPSAMPQPQAPEAAPSNESPFSPLTE